jgi:hypothetical protein
MEPLKVQIVNVIGDVYAVEAEDGQKVFNLITKAFADGQKVNISFQNIEMLTTAFLNTAVGQLYKDFTEEFVKENLSVSEISDSGIVSLKRVVDTAKLYFKDPEAMQRSINDILED